MRHIAKIAGWTLGMAMAAFLIFDGKSTTPNADMHATLGALAGLAIGCVFVWSQMRHKR